MAYFDEKTCLLCDKAEYYDSENSILWLTEFLTLLGKRDSISKRSPKLIAQIAVNSLMVSGIPKPAPDPSKFPGEGFSRDNMIAMTSLGLTYGLECKDYGIKFFDFPRYLQPQDTCYFLYCYHWLFKPLIIITWLNMLWSFWSLGETGDGGLHTDGRLLSFVRFEALSSKGIIHRFLYKLGQKMSSYRVKKFFTKNPDRLPVGMTIDTPTWRIIFALYFQDRQHPNNKMAGDIW